MAERNIFYSSIDPGLREELNIRKKYLSSFNRSAEAEAWLYQKTAYVKLQAVRRADDTPDAVILNNEEIIITSEIKNRTQTTGYFQNTYDASDRFVPQAVVTGLSVANEGKLGSLNKTTVSFTVFSRKQLDKLERHFQIPGKNVKVEYGWTQRTTSQKLQDPDRDTFYTNRKTYIGVIYNFSQQLRPDGGFDCTIQLVSPGSLAAGINTKQSSTKTWNANKLNELNANLDLYQMPDNIRKQFKNDEYYAFLEKPAKVTNGKPFHTKSIDALAMRIGILKIDKTAAVTNTDLQQGAAKRSNSQTDIYINLGAIVNYMLNLEIIAEYALINKFHLEFHPTNSYYMDPGKSDLLAADPRRILLPLPEHRNYDGNNGASLLSFPEYNGAEPCLAHIMISLTEIERIIEKNKDESTYSVTQFLNDVFAIISSETGGCIEPALVNFDESTNGKTADQKNRITYIVNQRFVPATTSVIEKYEFQAFGSGSELRDLTLSTKLPDRFATAMYVGASAPGKSIEHVTMDFFGDDQSTDANTTTNNNNKTTEVASFENIFELSGGKYQVRGKAKGVAEKIGFDVNARTDVSDFEIGSEFVRDAKKKIAAYNAQNSSDKLSAIQSYIENFDLSEDIIKVLQTYVRELSTLSDQPWNRLIVLPIDATFTIDGVNGFRFGNVIDISYLPLRYKRKGIEFIVTKVEDVVQGSEWLTTVTLQCRVANTEAMKSKNASGGGTRSSSSPTQTGA